MFVETSAPASEVSTPEIKTVLVGRKNATATRDFVALVDGMVDDYLKMGGKLDSSKLLDRIKLPKACFEEIRQELTDDMSGFEAVANAYDASVRTEEQKYLIEGWSNVSKKQIRTILDFYKSFDIPSQTDKPKKEKKAPTEKFVSLPEVIAPVDEMLFFCKDANRVQLYSGGVIFNGSLVSKYAKVEFVQLAKKAPVGSYVELIESMKSAKKIDAVPTGRMTKAWELISA